MKTVGLLLPLLVVAACSNQEPSFSESEARVTSGDSEGVPTPADDAGEPTDGVPADDGSSDQDGESDGPSDDDGASDVDGGTDEASEPSSGDGGDEFTSQIKTNESQTVTVDSFYMNEIFPVRQQIDRAAEPLKTQRTTQDAGLPRSVIKSVLGRGTHSQSFQKKPALRYAESHNVAATGKPVDIFVTVDDSESFSATSISRAKAAVRKLVQDLNDTDWVLYIGGLEGVGGGYDKTRIAKGSMTLAAAQTATDAALTTIFAEGSLGDERVFRSLNRLAYDYRTQDRDGATHVYLAITDAPNCKDRNNAESGTCQRQVGRDDHLSYLLETNANRPVYMRHMAVFGAYYRMTDNVDTCGNADGIEAPLANETLKMQSQYAELAFQWQRLVYPSTATDAAPSWVGDLCSGTEGLSWLTSLTDAAKDVAARRFRTANQPDTFSLDPAFNLKLTTSADADVPGTDYSIQGGRVLILSNSLAGSYKAVYHLNNEYRRTDYPDFFTLEPAADTVTLTWNNGSTDCVLATSFAGLDAGISCRHSARSLYLRDVSFLPTVQPGQAALTVTVSYENKVEEVTRIDVTAVTPIYLGTLTVAMAPAAASSLIASAVKSTLTPDGRSARITFASPLPPGDYRIEYFERSQTSKNLALNEPAVPEADAVLCVIPSLATAKGLGADGALYATPPSAIFPCTLDAAGEKVSYEGFVPVDPTSGQPDLLVLFKGYLEPVDVFALDYPPHADTLSVVVDGTTLGAADFTVANNQLTLDSPLLPGSSLTIEYEFWPPLRSCFPLSSVAHGKHEYFVWYGALDDEQTLEATKFEITKDALGKGKVCLDPSLPSYGRRLIVGYISDEKKT